MAKEMSLERTQEVMHSLFEITPMLVDGMRQEIKMLKRELYKTPKWRKVKRYRLFERIDKLEEDEALITHVMLDDEY